MMAEIADGISLSAGIAQTDKSIAEKGDVVIELYDSGYGLGEDTP